MALQQERPTSIDPRTRIGLVALNVADLARSVRFYTEAIGLQVIERRDDEAVLGAGGAPLLVLHEQPGALPWMTDRMTGLYHFAILVPTRGDLGRWLAHYFTTGYPPPGQGDHVVSEALYLRDPDGHGVEVYADRPREGWVWENGRVRMGGGPVDVRGIIAEGEKGGPFQGMPAGTTIGHVHLQVGDLKAAERFYHGVLGFDLVAGGDTALFVSAGGYHHHLGLNTWHSAGAPPAPPDVATLRYYTIALPDEAAAKAVLARLDAAGIAHREEGSTIAVDDPWGHTILLHASRLPLGVGQA